MPEGFDESTINKMLVAQLAINETEQIFYGPGKKGCFKSKQKANAAK